MHPGTSELVQRAAVLSADVLSALSLPWGLMSCLSAAVLSFRAANQGWPLLQAESLICCRDADTFLSSHRCFVALGNTLSLLYGKPGPADSFTHCSFWSLFCTQQCAEYSTDLSLMVLFWFGFFFGRGGVGLGLFFLFLKMGGCGFGVSFPSNDKFFVVLLSLFQGAVFWWGFFG